MPIERENESARRADWSAARRAGATARQGGPRGVGNVENGKNAPERQAAPASSGTKMQGGWEECPRGELRLAEMRRASGPLSFGGLLRSRPEDIGTKVMTGDACDSLDVANPFSRNFLPLGHRLRRDAPQCLG